MTRGENGEVGGQTRVHEPFRVIYVSKSIEVFFALHNTVVLGLSTSPVVRGCISCGDEDGSTRTEATRGVGAMTNTGTKKRITPASAAVFPGSFDPLTNGHVDIIERSVAIFGHVVVGVLNNPSKKSLFSEEERVALIKREFAGSQGHVTVVSFSGLLVDFVQSLKSRVVIRGLRAISDFDYEAQMALINRKLAPTIETLFLTAREEHSYISSSVVKQVALLGGDVTGMVPASVARALKSKRVKS